MKQERDIVLVKMDELKKSIPDLTLDNAKFLGFMSVTRTFKIIDDLSGIEPFKEITKLKKIMDIRLSRMADREAGIKGETFDEYLELCLDLREKFECFDFDALPYKFIHIGYCITYILSEFESIALFDFDNVDYSRNHGVNTLAGFALASLEIIQNYLQYKFDDDCLYERETQAKINENPLIANELRRIDEDMAFLKTDFDHESIIRYMEKYKTIDILA